MNYEMTEKNENSEAADCERSHFRVIKHDTD